MHACVCDIMHEIKNSESFLEGGVLKGGPQGRVEKKQELSSRAKDRAQEREYTEST